MRPWHVEIMTWSTSVGYDAAVIELSVIHDPMSDPSLEDVIQRTARVLKEEGARAVYVFGSAARGELRSDSDLDLAVEGLPVEKLSTALGRAWDAAGRPVDLIDAVREVRLLEYLRSKGELRRVA